MEKENNKLQKKKKYRIYAAVVIIIIIILLLLHSCGAGKKYKIKLHYGDEVIEVDQNFKLGDLDVDGGKITFLVDSDGHVVDPNSKLDSKKEYSAHIIPDGKEKVKVTYKTDNSSLTIEYQKGAGLLFPSDPVKEGYIFIGWKDESIDDYPIYMMPVDHDMVLVAVFEKSVENDGKCTLNCDTNKDGKCDINCDTNGDGKPDKNIDTNGDGKPDLNVDLDHDGKCDLNCDTNKDGKCDLNCDSHDTKMEYVYSEDEVHFGCDSTGFDLFLKKSTELAEAIIDGKVVEPDEWNMNANSEQKYAGWTTSISEYFQSGKTISFVATLISVDQTGQKYYKIANIKLIFPGDCKKEEEIDDIPSTSGEVLELHYNCDTPHGVIINWPKDRIQSLTFDGEYIEPAKYNENNFPRYDLREYKGSGKTIEVLGKVTDYYNEDYEFTVYLIFSNHCEDPNQEPEKKTYTISFDANGGTVYPTSKTVKSGDKLGTLPIPTRSGYTFDKWYTSSGAYVTSDTIVSGNGKVYAHWNKIEEPQQTQPNETPSHQEPTTPNENPTQQEPTPPVDNGTISLTARSTCLINGQTTSVIANVNNAIDSTVDWLADSCLSVSSQGNTATIRGNNCGTHPNITGRLHNGATDTVTFNYEDALSFTVTDTRGNRVSPENGVYNGNSLTITTNIPAYITGRGILGDESKLRSSVTTNGATTASVNIRTSCGQTQTISISPIIN